jgi:hypothetical protein
MSRNSDGHPLDNGERYGLKLIEEGLRQDQSPEAKHLKREYKKFNRKLGIHPGLLALGGLAAIGIGIGSVFTVQAMSDNEAQQRERTVKAVELVLQNPTDLTKLGICAPELVAQATYIDALTEQAGDSVTTSLRPDSSAYAAAANAYSLINFRVPCSPENADVVVSETVEGEVVTLTPSDVVDMNVDGWCADRSSWENFTILHDGNDRLYYDRVLAAGDAMMRQAGLSCTATALPLPSMTAGN